MFMEAIQLYDDGDIDGSLMIYTLLAELGMEVAQSNAAFLLEQGQLHALSDKLYIDIDYQILICR